MEAIAFIARFVLAGVFAVAGIAKLFDRPGSREALKGFGVPDALVPAGAIALPIIELAIAAALLIPSTFVFGAVAAAGLLGVFIVGIGVNMALGRAPDCHCFGQLHSKPAGWETLIRNLALGGLAGIVVWRGDSATLSNITSGDLLGIDGAAGAWLIALAVIAAVQTISVVALLRQNGRILLRLDALEAGGVSEQTPSVDKQTAGLPVGSTAPEFSLPGLHGETMTLGALRSPGKPVVLLFTDPNCGPCNSLMPDVKEWQRREDHTVVLVSRGSVEDNAGKAEEHGLGNILLQKDFEVAEAYRFQGTPSAVIVDAAGRVSSALVAGPPAIRGLMKSRLEPTRQVGVNQGPHALPVGNRAHNFELFNLDGERVQLAHFKGRDTVLLFWNPTCGFCRKMLDDLKRWEGNRQPDAPELLVISQGSKEDVLAQGFASTVLLDEGGIAAAFGATGTPVAVLVDADMRVGSPLAVGAQAVLELTGAESLSA